MSPVKPAVLLLLLAIDDASLPLRKNVCLHLSTPTVRQAPVLEPSPVNSAAPDNLAAHFYGTVLHEPGRASGPFRMWYYACHRGRNPDWPPRMKQQVAREPGWLKGVADGFEVGQGPLCYAESDDGLTWRKPALGQVLFKGSRDNNALALPHTIVSGAAVIRDDADPDPARRYKMVYQYFPDQTEPVIPEYGTLPTIACAVSPDGLRWTVTAMPFVNQFVEHCSFIRHAGAYIVHSQVFPGESWTGVFTEGGAAGGRAGVAHSTYDFDRWPDLWEWAFALPEPADRAARGASRDQPNHPQVHLGVGAASFGNVCVGVYGLWHDRKNFGAIACDLGLVVSNDGVRFREPAATPGQPFIHRDDSPVQPVPGKPMPTILCQGNGILNVGNETRIYHGRWRNSGQDAQEIAAHYRAEVALATLPRDRWGGLAVAPGAKEGTVCSAAIRLPAEPFEIRLNADGCRGMKVELLDEKFRPIAGFAGDDAGSSAADGGLDCPVTWRRGGLGVVQGRTARVLVTMQRAADAPAGAAPPRLYAISLAGVRAADAPAGGGAAEDDEHAARPAKTAAGTAFALLPASDQPAPTLLLFAKAGADTLSKEPYCRVGRLLHERGWNVVSLDLPCHGDDLVDGEPEELAGWAKRIQAGDDLVAAFRGRVNDVLEHLVATNIADRGRIAAAGTSRGGFMAFQAAAGNPLIRAVAAFSPVTDLAALSEFRGLEGSPLVNRLSLKEAAPTLAGRQVWITIGNADERVGTDKATAFAAAIERAAKGAARVTLRVLPVAGHRSHPEWHDAAAAWLAETLASPDRQP